MPHLSVQCKISKARMFGKAVVMVEHEIFVVASYQLLTCIVWVPKKSAAPVGNSVGNAQEMYPSVVNLFTGFPVVKGQLTCCEL